MDVVVVRWPIEAERRAAVRQAGAPRLLLVEADHPPPLVEDCLEDWVRLPAPDDEVKARLEALSARSHAHPTPRPQLDSDDVLRFGSGWVPLPPVEARLTRALVERFGAVVRRETLSRAAWPGECPGRNALDVHMVRLRRRLGAVGLAIRTVRARGYLLERSCREQAASRRPSSTADEADTLPA